MEILKKNLIPFSLIFLLILLVVTIIFSILVGTADINAKDVMKIIMNDFFGNKFLIDENNQFIIKKVIPEGKKEINYENFLLMKFA